MKESEIVRLDAGIKFPDLRNRLDSGIIAYGGDLSITRLLEAYSKGIFPWYDSQSPIIWHSPIIRCVFQIDGFKVSHSLKQKLKKRTFTFTFDQHFREVIQSCALIKRKGETGTWILNEVIDAYTNLHEAGYAHSLEVWNENKLAGGLFGVSLGKAFFGESMFHLKTDASKAAMFFLFDFLRMNEFHFVDAQMHTEHLESLGADLLHRDEYLDLLENALKFKSIKGNWDNYVRRDGYTPGFYGRSH